MTAFLKYCTKIFNFVQKWHKTLTWLCFDIYNLGAFAKCGRKEIDDMKTCYAKTVLYVYSRIEGILDSIDQVVEDRALSAFGDFSPCLEQAEKIIALTEQKDVLIDLKLLVDKIIKKFSDYERDCLDYKYFKLKPKTFYENFDFTSRMYFRAQEKLVKKFSKEIEESGLDDKAFEEKYLKIPFLMRLYKSVIEREKLSIKNKSKKNLSKDFQDAEKETA